MNARALPIALCALATLSATKAFAAPSVRECIEANESSIARRKEQKLRDAATQSLLCAESSCPAEVRAECERRLQDVRAATPSVIFVIKNGDGGELTDVKVTMDGQPFVARLDGAAKEADPGEHVFVFEPKGQPRLERKIVLREGEKLRRETITLGGGKTASTSAAPAFGPFQIAGLAAAGVGVASLAVGTVFGLRAQAKRDDADCKGTSCPSPEAAATLDDAAGKATLSTVFFVAGGALVLGGAGLFLFGPKPNDAQKPTSSAGLRVAPLPGGGMLGYAATW